MRVFAEERRNKTDQLYLTAPISISSVVLGKYFATLDGPITANYNMGLHHAYNRTFKDAMMKFAALNGCDQHFQNGFF